jgi:hypothetical protein
MVDGKAAMVRCDAVAAGANRLPEQGQGMDESEIRQKLEGVRSEHRDLDDAIAALLVTGASDQLQIARLKKRKLMLRDEIAVLEDQLIPDIIA